jgi:sortase (surface protein transpeptidase)
MTGHFADENDGEGGESKLRSHRNMPRKRHFTKLMVVINLK